MAVVEWPLRGGGELTVGCSFHVSPLELVVRSTCCVVFRLGRCVRVHVRAHPFLGWPHCGVLCEAGTNRGSARSPAVH